jgi:hypothetical protein
MSAEELSFIERVAVATHIADWRLLGCILEGSYAVLSGEEERRVDQWLESHFTERRARRVFDRIMEPGLYISQVKKKGDSTSPARSARAEDSQKKEEDSGPANRP